MIDYKIIAFSSVKFIDKHNRWINLIGLICFIVALILTAIWALSKYELEPWAALFGILSSCFFSLHSVADFVRQPDKLINEMSVGELIFFILTSDRNVDWQRITNNGQIEMYLKRYPALRFIMDENPENDNYRTNWANSFPDPHAESYKYSLLLNNNLIRNTILVTVDGGRVEMPQINELNMKAHPFDYKVAQLFDLGNQLNSYMLTAGITVDV